MTNVKTLTCPMNGCESPLGKRSGMCDSCYRKERARRLGPCTVEGCDTLQSSKGLCMGHYLAERRKQMPPCSVDRCSKPQLANGWCSAHDNRNRRYGDPLGSSDYEPPTGSDNPNWKGDDITYHGMHRRLRRMRGGADRCEFDGGHSGPYDWALDHRREIISCKYETKTNERGYSVEVPYSTNVDDYIPLCRPCHARFDATRAGSMMRVDH